MPNDPQLDFIYDIYLETPELLNERDIVKLKKAGYIKEEKKVIKDSGKDVVEKMYKKRDFSVATQAEQVSSSSFEYDDYSGGNITKEDWLPDDIIAHKKDFYLWIDSINSGFRNRINYGKFNKYVQQAMDWMSENKTPSDFMEDSDRFEYMVNELRRIGDNTLYFALKYAYLQEPSLPAGRRKYVAGEDYTHHRILFYLLDCGYSFMLGKPRQIGSTSALGIAAICKTITKRNHFLKFITEDKDTGIEIFNDKLMFVFNQIPEWMRTYYHKGEKKSIVLNDREGFFRLGKKGVKGGDKGINSKIEIVAPKRTAINGGSPQIVFIDEIGSIPILAEMMNEGRPTMFYKDPDTGKLMQRRQILLWGCVCAGTKVWNNYGELVNIEDLNKKDGILGFDQETGEISKEEITYWQPPFEKPCYKITLKGGRVLECSEDHPILASKPKDYKYFRRDGKRSYKKNVDFIETKEIKPGYHVAVIDEVPIFGAKTMEDPRFIGYMIGDGNYGTTENTPRRQPRFYNCDEDICNYIESKYDYTITLQRKTKDGRGYKEYSLRGVTDLLRDAGIHGQQGSNKRLPENFHNYSKHDMAEVIGGLFDTDGCVHNYKSKIDIDSCSKIMLDELRLALQKFGIKASVYRVKARIAEHRKDKNDYWRLDISESKSIIKFRDEITLTVKYKQNTLNEKADELLKRGRYSKMRSKDHPGMLFETVDSVEYIGVKPVYNLTAETTNTYIANGIITHNTGTTGKGGGAYEKEWKRLKGLWDDREFESGVIPIFFDWTTRCDDNEYVKEKKYYYGSRAKSQNLDIEISKVQFHQHYPSSPSDMFMVTEKTLMSREFIDSNIDRIKDIFKKYDREGSGIAPVQYGYFDPIFDTTKPTDENQDVPYAIIGANWVPCDELDERWTTILFQHPNKDWKHRYYQGTDPISADTGASKMSSAIWDKYYNTVSCVVNHRESNNPSYSFLQCLLMNLYYGGVTELVERNIGLAYKQYIENKGYYKQFMVDAELPPSLQSSGSANVGVDNKGARARTIINYMGEVFNTFGSKIFIRVAFEQLKTFVCKVSKDGRTETWGTSDTRYYDDDVLFAITFSYLCSISSNRMPENIKENANKKRVVTRGYYDANYNYKLKTVYE